MTTDEYSRAAYALLGEGIILLRAHAGEGDVINRYVATVERLQAQRREPASPPPAVVPTCKAWCGLDLYDPRVPIPMGEPDGESYIGRAATGSRSRGFCSRACRDAACPPVPRAPAPEEPLSPPPSDPVTVDDIPWQVHPKGSVAAILASDPATVATRARPTHCQCPYHNCAGTLENPDHELCERCYRSSLDTCASPVTVATGGVPTGFRLGDGWMVDRTYLCSCTGCLPNTSTEYYKPRNCGKGACVAHAVEMGALVPVGTAPSVTPGHAGNVPIDTARSVPPGPVPVEAPRTCPRGFAWCGHTDWGNCKEAGCFPSHGRHWCSTECTGVGAFGSTAGHCERAEPPVVVGVSPASSVPFASPTAPAPDRAPPPYPTSGGTVEPLPVEPVRAALEEIEDILSSFGQLGRELLTYTQFAFGTKHSEAVPRPADEIVYKALRRVRALKASISSGPTPPAAPASEPAVRPLSERVGSFATAHVVAADVRQWSREIAALEVELAKAERLADARFYDHERTRTLLMNKNDAARAEVEQLKARLSDMTTAYAQATDTKVRALEAGVKAKAEATARVRSMREAAAIIADRHEWGRTRGCLCNACKSGREIRALSDDQPVPAKQAESLEAGRSVALPLDTGTATATPLCRAVFRRPSENAPRECALPAGHDPGERHSDTADTGGEVRERVHGAIRSADEKGCCNLPACALRTGRTCTTLCDELVAAFEHAPQADAKATDTGGEAELADPHLFCAHPPERNHACDIVERRQADAIKAAVADERQRCLAWVNHSILDGLRSGEDAPGPVTPAKGGE